MSKADRFGATDSTSGRRCRDRVALGHRPLVLAALALAAMVARSGDVRACSAYSVGPPAAIPLPPTGTRGVPTATSFVVASVNEPEQLELEANGAPIRIDPPTLLGTGSSVGGSFGLWRITPTGGQLPPSAAVVLSGVDQTYPGRFSTAIFTAADTDTTVGTPAHIGVLTLQLLRFRPDQVGGQSCVASARIGWAALSLDGAQVPGTAPNAVLNTVTLVPKTGGAAQSHMFIGQDMYTGETPTPAGPRDFPGWTPELDPAIEYCATVTSFGVGDLARAPLVSNTVCASVVEVADTSTGAGGSGGAPGARSVSGDGPPIGCSVVGGGPPSSACAAAALLFAAWQRRRRVSVRA
jgi:hypothetical protein